ncbi:alpha-hydroxy-acid oxidizing protein, partial [Mesorhizobium sp. M1E.F.Ca.ET.063.01.1.1]
LGDTGAGLTIAARVGRNLHAGFDWNEFRTIRDWWKGPLIVKGVLHPGDAARLIAEGADGIWMSNHGGRQLDGAVSSIDAITMVRDAVGGRVPILIDSGIRTGIWTSSRQKPAERPLPPSAGRRCLEPWRDEQASSGSWTSCSTKSRPV